MESTCFCQEIEASNFQTSLYLCVGSLSILCLGLQSWRIGPGCGIKIKWRDWQICHSWKLGSKITWVAYDILTFMSLTLNSWQTHRMFEVCSKVMQLGEKL